MADISGTDVQIDTRPVSLKMAVRFGLILLLSGGLLGLCAGGSAGGEACLSPFVA